MDYKRGIDVSQWQGVIDWAAVKASGIEFAMIRAGYGRNNIDPRWKRNADECTRLGIPFGVYWFSYALNVDMARREAQYCIQAIKPYNLDYPVAFDFEYDSVNNAAKANVTVTKQLASDIARAFCEEIRAAGYTPILYANPDYLSRYFDDNVVSRYDIWLAQWPKRPNLDVPPENADIWQYSNSGSIKGISGRVDMNACYKDYIQEDDEMVTYEQIKPFIEQYIQDRRAKPGSSWSVNERNWAVGAGLYEGSDTGMMWQDSISREQSAAVAMRHYNYAMGETEKLIDKSVKELKDYVDEAVTKAINEAVQDAVNEALRK